MTPIDRPAATQAAADFICSVVDLSPKVAVILGSGLGQLADRIEGSVAISFADIPGFRTSTVPGHRGQLILGTIESVPVVAMAGRFHRYEGWSYDEAAFPVRVMDALGTKYLIVSNAAGGVSPKLAVGDIVIIRDHINLMMGFFSGTRDNSVAMFPRGDATYDDALSRIAISAAIENNFAAYLGTYLATSGPNYETRAEYRMMRRIGADVVGMSTVPEVLAASQLGMRVLGLSMVGNVASPDRPVKTDHDEVLVAGRAAGVKMETIVRKVLRSL